MYDFANILFSGHCNANCPFCIGRQIDPLLNEHNLNRFPPQNLGRLIAMIWQQQIQQVILTGTNTDPQLYQHEAALIGLLREQLPARTQLVLHTNGRLALQKIDVFNQYDRATLSFPSFDADIYRSVMGVVKPPDLKEILLRSRIPIKISCLVCDVNPSERADFLNHCLEVGVKRLVFRKLYQERRGWAELLPLSLELTKVRGYRGNPVFNYRGMEVTLWDFEETKSTSLNLFSNGWISDQYLLAKTIPQGIGLNVEQPS